MTQKKTATHTTDELIRCYRKIPANGIESVLIDWKSNQNINNYIAKRLEIIEELREKLFAETDTERYLRKNKGNGGLIFSKADLDDFLDTNITREDLLIVNDEERKRIRAASEALIKRFAPYEGDVASILAIAVRKSLLGQYIKDLTTYYQQNKGNLERLGNEKKQFRNTESIVNLENFLILCYRKLEYDLIII